ncbi:hypothetical protein Syun_006652 [Stephania yunnanensis]|uniref:Uncharacterized protein n=1 Tax=Stephania yunnanensis TaxID=152371 RepID=A0AAP0KX56_9MAGN
MKTTEDNHSKNEFNCTAMAKRFGKQLMQRRLYMRRSASTAFVKWKRRLYKLKQMMYQLQYLMKCLSPKSACLLLELRRVAVSQEHPHPLKVLKGNNLSIDLDSVLRTLEHHFSPHMVCIRSALKALKAFVIGSALEIDQPSERYIVTESLPAVTNFILILRYHRSQLAWCGDSAILEYVDEITNHPIPLGASSTELLELVVTNLFFGGQIGVEFNKLGDKVLRYSNVTDVSRGDALWRSVYLATMLEYLAEVNFTCGGFSTMAITEDGKLWNWGDWGHTSTHTDVIVLRDHEMQRQLQGVRLL